jgi:gamma-glutamyltranspeptidase / glutathione hydrolase
MTQFTTSEWLMDKTGASSDGGMVVTKQDLASLAGAQALADGGNAIDAAVTAGWVMAVMEPYNNSIGGAGYMVFRAADGTAHVVDYSPRAPAKATQERLKSRTGPAFSGALAAAVPGMVSGLAVALERFGTFSLARAMAPAIEIAEDGMPLDWLLTLRLIQELNGLRANPKSAEIFLVNGDPGMAHGETVLRQTDLARTLRSIAEQGPEAFYEGEIAGEIVDFVNERGGIMQRSDFAGFSATVAEPLRGRYRDYTILTPPPPSPGLMTLQGLQMLEAFNLSDLGHNSVDALHVMAESYRLAFADRDAYLGDPDFTDQPVDILLSDEYIERRRAQIDRQRAMTKPLPGEIGRTPVGVQAPGGGTTHLSVVDAEGNMVSLTQTIIGGLSGLGVAGNTGVVMNCCLQWFDYQPDAPNSVAPGKRPLTNMTPIIAERDGRAVLAVGAPGSRRITNAVSQVTLNALEFGMPIQPAISAPRIDLSLDHIIADERIDAAVLQGLREHGHRVDAVREFINEGGPETQYRGNFARPAAVFVDEQGIRHGGDYPFVQGMAVGVPRR